MSWHLVEREDVRVGDVIRLVVPNVLAIEEGADGRPAFGYGAGDVYVERFTPDDVGDALAGAGIGDLRRGIPLDDWKAEAGPDGIRISGLLPDGMSLDGDLSQYSVFHPPAGVDVTLAEGDLPRCPATDPDEGLCLYAPHDDGIPHWYSMFAHSPVTAPETMRRSPEAGS